MRVRWVLHGGVVQGVPYGGEDPANIVRSFFEIPAAARCWCGEVMNLALRDGRFLCMYHRST
jgi:hypothetical protein